MGRMSKYLPPITDYQSLEDTFRKARLFMLSGNSRGIHTEVAMVILDGPQHIIPVGWLMQGGREYVALYAEHRHRSPEVVYAPILQSDTGHRTLGKAVTVHNVSARDFPNIIPIELYGQAVGEA